MCPVHEGAFSPLETMQGARVRLSEDILLGGGDGFTVMDQKNLSNSTESSGRPFTGPGDLWRGSSQAGRGVFGFPEALRVCQWIPRARGCGCLHLQAMTPTRRRFIDGCYE